MRSMVEGMQQHRPPPARFARHLPRKRGRNHVPCFTGFAIPAVAGVTDQK
jgi:hypothetical protein